VHPYVEASIDKAAVYALAAELGLGDLERLPAQPCLASRVETGIAIAAEDLAFIDAVESRLAARLGREAVLRCRVTHAGIVIELGAVLASAAAANAHEIASEACVAAGRRFAGVRRYTREDGDALIARMSPGRLTLVLVTASLVVMWINARTIEVAPRRAPMRGLAVASLGPDVLADGFDPQLAASRALAHSSRMIADVLLDQRVAAGIGNIWKCESLFARGIDPRTLVGALTQDEIASVYASARELMLAGLAPEARAAARSFAVYSRTNQRCPRCASLITVYQLGDPPRWTWSCPSCQPGGAVVGVSS